MAALLVFDITKEETFRNCRSWLSQLKKYGEKNWEIMLIGNKIDLEDERAVKYEQAHDFAKENDIMYYETSAMDGSNVKEAFDVLLNKVIESIRQHEKNLSQNPSLLNYTNSMSHYKKSVNPMLSSKVMTESTVPKSKCNC